MSDGRIMRVCVSFGLCMFTHFTYKQCAGFCLSESINLESKLKRSYNSF